MRWALWSLGLWVAAGSGCSDGVADTIVMASDAGMPNQPAAGGGGSSGSDSNPGGLPSNIGCEGYSTAENAGSTRNENSLFYAIGEKIDAQADCAGVPFDKEHDGLDFSEDLRCQARAQAKSLAAVARFLPGPGGDPQGTGFFFRPPRDQSALDEILDNAHICEELQSPEYTELGIGYYDEIWVLLFGPMNRPRGPHGP